MRRAVLSLGLGGLVLLLGCNTARMGVINRGPDGPPSAGTGQVPTVAALVKYMDDNAQLIQSLRCDDVELSVHQGLKPIPSLPASLACQRPRNFRMTARF